MIELKNISFTYEKSGEGVKDINLNIKQGELVVLTGKSGSGKTTITRLINGLAGTFYSGISNNSICINNESFSKIPMWKRGKIIGSVFQDPRSQFFAHEVESEIAFGCENYGYITEDIRKRVTSSVQDLKISKLCKRKLVELSNGEKQKVSIASIYAISPEVYVFDEPSSNLDEQATEELGVLIKYLKECGKTIIVSEHRIWYLIDIADRFVHLDKGRIVEIVNKHQLLNKTINLLKMQGIRSTCKPVKKIDKNIECLENKYLDEMINVESLSFCYKNKEIFNSLSFSIRKGEIVALTGKNGVGKTTLARILCGLEKHQKGNIYINGKLSNKKQRLKDIRYVPHDTDSQLFTDNLMNEMLLTIDKTDENKEIAVKLLKEINLYTYINRHPATLSGGQKQRLILASALLEKRKIMIFDEPTSGLDSENTVIVANAMKKMVSKGVTILIITHDIEMMNECCDRYIEIT